MTSATGRGAARDINHVIAYGQSLALGYEGWPALSLTQPYDSLMLGDSVRPSAEVCTDWRPLGGANFRPLVATVHSDDWQSLRTSEQVAALRPGAVAPGETVLEAAVNALRGRQLQAGVAIGRERLLASAVGVGGRSIEALSPGAEPNLFNRLRSCMTHARTAAGAAGLSYGVTALLFLQGEHNAAAADGGTDDREQYQALLAALHRAMLAEVVAVTGQTDAPGFFSYQTGGAYANRSNSIAQAQLDFCRNTPDCVMVGPSYPVTEKAGHLDANGYRWLGAQFGKVMHRVLILGEPFAPLHPLRADRTGRRILIVFHVPVPPLGWGRPFAGQDYADPRDGGFSVWDEAGEVAIADVGQTGPDRLELTLGRDAVGDVRVHYADSTRGGRGVLHDSDPEQAPDSYIYDPATGHYETADHPELNGQPYALRNWCVAFAMPVDVAAPTVLAAPVPEAMPSPPLPPLPPRAGAWDALRSMRTEVTGERVERGGWLSRLIGVRSAPVPRPAAPIPPPPQSSASPPAPVPPVVTAPAQPTPPAPLPVTPPDDDPSGRYAGLADLTFVSVDQTTSFGRAGSHQRLELFAAEPLPPPPPAHNQASLPPDYRAEHDTAAAPESVAAYSIAGGVVWSSGLVTLGRRFVAPPDCVPGYFRHAFSSTAPPLEASYAGALGRADVRTLEVNRPVLVATHPNLGYGTFLLEVLPRLWLAAELRRRGADIPLVLSRTVPEWLPAWVDLLHRDRNVIWYDGATERVRAPAIVLTGMLHTEQNFHPAMSRMVADLLAAASPTNPRSPTRVYLMSPGEQRLSNASEVESAFVDLGFSIVNLHNLDAPEQIRLLAGVQIVAGEHAGVMRATLFAPSGARVLALNFADNSLSAIARLRRHRVAYVAPVDGAFRHWRLGFGLSRMFSVDVADVRRTVAELLDGT